MSSEDGKIDPREVVAGNLRRLRLGVGFSQEDLARRSGLHRTYISSIERGQRNVAVENLFVLASALGCDPRELLAPLATSSDSDEGGAA